MFSGRFIPEYEQAYAAGVAVDEGTRGPAVDQRLRTEKEGIFAAGNILRGAERAGVAAREGRYAADMIHAYLHKPTWPRDRIALYCKSPLTCVSPNRIAVNDSAPPVWLMTWRVDKCIEKGIFRIEQDGRVLYERNVGRLLPNRRLVLCSGDWIKDVRLDGSALTAEIVSV